MNAIETIQNAYPITLVLLLALGGLSVVFFFLELKHSFAPMPRLLGVPRSESEKRAPIATGAGLKRPAFSPVPRIQMAPARA